LVIYIIVATMHDHANIELSCI